jgi:hypothetical protein
MQTVIADRGLADPLLPGSRPSHRGGTAPQVEAAGTAVIGRGGRGVGVKEPGRSPAQASFRQDMEIALRHDQLPSVASANKCLA